MLTGSIVAMVTPMNSDGSIDWDSLVGLVNYHIDKDTDGIVSVGTTGESATLSPEEHIQVIEKTIGAARGRIPVIAGTGSNSTEETILLTRGAAEVGASACLLVVPYYNKPPQEGLYRHFRAVAEAVSIPQIVYNVPGRTSIDLANETTLRLAQIENIIGIKDATNDLERGIQLIEQSPPDFAIYSGEDGTACQLMLAGGKGTISVTANVAPNLMHKMCTAAVAGESSLALEYDAQLRDLHEAMFIQANPMPAKWAVCQQKLIDNGIRLPLIELEVQHHDTVRNAMMLAGVI